jgi:hypothetical protein
MKKKNQNHQKTPQVFQDAEILELLHTGIGMQNGGSVMENSRDSSKKFP